MSWDRAELEWERTGLRAWLEDSKMGPGGDMATISGGQRWAGHLLPAPGKLTGMSEITEKLTLPEKCRSDHAIVQQVTSAANVGRVPCGADNEYR